MSDVRIVDVEFLEAYAEAWNAHDVDRIMQSMTDDCVFEAAGGKAVYGARSEGRDAVRARFVAVWDEIPDAS